MRIDDEILAAYVDGELDAEEKAQVDAAARTDAALARRIQAQRKLREAMGRVYGQLLSDAPPDRLVKAAQATRAPAEIVDLSAARRKRVAAEPAKGRGGRWLQWGAIAACAVLAVGVGLRAWRGGPSPQGMAMVSGSPGVMVATGPLAGALDNQLAASGYGATPVRIGVSFRTTDGRDCRTFQVQTSEGFAGLACRENDGWRVRATVAQAPGADTAYRQAGSETPPAILSSVQSLIAGQPFDARQEAAAKAGGWK